MKAASATYFGNAVLPVYLQNVTQDPKGGTFVSASAPMRVNDVITAYATGFGVTNPPVDAGTVPSRLSNISNEGVILQTPSTKQTWPTQNLGAVLSPQFPGLYQISFRVPATAVPDPDGTILVTFQVNGDAQSFKAYLTK